MTCWSHNRPGAAVDLPAPCRSSTGHHRTQKNALICRCPCKRSPGSECAHGERECIWWGVNALTPPYNTPSLFRNSGRGGKRTPRYWQFEHCRPCRHRNLELSRDAGIPSILACHHRSGFCGHGRAHSCFSCQSRKHYTTASFCTYENSRERNFAATRPFSGTGCHSLKTYL